MLSTVAMVGCSSVLCTDEILQKVSSPDGVLEAVTFYEDCGATSYMTLVALGSKGENLKVARKEGLPFAVNGKWEEVSLHWEDRRKLVISAKVPSKYIVNQAVRWRQVDLAYELTEAEPR